MWKTDEQEKWEGVRDVAFSKTLDNFLEFLKGQNQLVYAKDLVQGLTYTHLTSWNRVDVCRCILWNGVLLKSDTDAQVNIEIDVFGTVGHHLLGECRIYAHKKGLKLTEGWHIAEEPNADDMMRELYK
jgi:hypothetical protein